MIQKLKDLYSKIYHNTDESGLIYNFVLGVAIIAVSLIAIIEAVMQYEEDGLLTLIILLLLMIVLFVLVNMYPQKVKVFSAFITIPLNFAVFPFMFLVAEGGGIRSGMPVWMTMGILLLFLIADGAWFVIQLVMTLLIDSGLILYTYLNPDVVKVVDNEFYYYEDNLIAICTVTVSIGAVIKYQRFVQKKQKAGIEEALNEAHQEKNNAQRVNEEKKKLLESMSHDVRTPLNAIVGMVDMAEHHMEDSEKVRECLDRINESSMQVLQMINHILDVSELETSNPLDSKEELLENENEKLLKTEDGALKLNASGKHILVVEDNDINMEIICGILERTHARVTSAWSGEDAVRLIGQSKENCYDLILMDIQLPGMDGYSVARTIRSMDREDAMTIPIIAMTADALAQDVDKALSCGMDSHIAKPIDLEELFTKLSFYLYKE